MAESTPFFSRDDWLKATIVAGVVAADAIWIVVKGFSFDWASALRVVGACLLMFAVAEVYRRWRPFPKFVVMTREIAWLMAFSASGVILSYLVTTLDFPIIDAQLAAADRAIGFDWLAYYTYFTSRPFAGTIAVALYIAALPLIAVAVVVLTAMERSERAHELILAGMIGAIIAIVVSAVLPSAGALDYYRPDESGFLHHPLVDSAYNDVFHQLRAGELTTLSLADPRGLIAFPSYHAVLSTIVSLAFRGIGRYFWPLLVIDGAVLMTTPIEGGHHLVDMLAGVVVACVSVWLAALLRRRFVDQASRRKGMNSASASASLATWRRSVLR